MIRLRHTGIVVSDLTEALQFYRDLLGLRVLKTGTEHGLYIDMVLGMPGVRVRTVKLTTGDGSLVELLEFNSPVSKPRDARMCDLGPSHVAFTVGNVNEEYARLSAAGVRFISRPCNSPDGYAKVAFCRDPDGTAVELVEVVGAQRAPVADRSQGEPSQEVVT